MAGATVTSRMAGRQGVPAAVGDADAGAVAGGLEAHADPCGLIGREVREPPRQGQAARRLPHLDLSHDEDASGRLVGDVEQAAAHSGLEDERALVGREEPVLRATAPPRVELAGEHSEGELRLDLDVDRDGHRVAATHDRPFLGAALGVRLERGELPAPERVDLIEPALQMTERLRPQPIEPYPRILVDPAPLDQPAPAQHAQVAAHRRHAHPAGLGQLAGTPWPATQVVHDPATDGGGEPGQGAVDVDGHAAIVNLCG